jgi:hypothetical protein
VVRGRVSGREDHRVPCSPPPRKRRRPLARLAAAGVGMAHGVAHGFLPGSRPSVHRGPTCPPAERLRDRTFRERLRGAGLLVGRSPPRHQLQ